MSVSPAESGRFTPPCSAPDAVRAARNAAGFSILEPYGVVEVAGADRIAFLQAQLPADVAALAPGRGVRTARLDRLGRLRADLVVAIREDAALLLVERALAAALAEDLERYRFGEDVAVAEGSARLGVIELHGPRVPELLLALTGARVPLETGGSAEIVAADVAAVFVAHPWAGDPGGHLIAPRADLPRLVEALRGGMGDVAPVPLDADALEILRIEGGAPRFGIDYDDRTLLHELGRDTEMVSYTKGCYLGQETVARVHARGAVHRRLAGLEIEGTAVPARGTLLLVAGEPAGEVRSATASPVLERVIALAMVRRAADAPGTVLHARIGDALVPAVVRELPLYRRPGPREEAARLHERGLAAFAADRHEEALACFARATLLDAANAAAWEALGVVQERLGRPDEAVAVMETLAEIDPDNPMAWTNLSRLYAREGRIEDAEGARGKALHLAWKKEAGESEARRRAAEADAARRRGLEERIPLFEEVLALDPDDGVARFGLGKALLDLGRPAEAAPHFERATALDPDYSMAWNHLAACLIETGRLREARAALERGIDAATRRGDLMPRRAMAARLAEIGEDS